MRFLRTYLAVLVTVLLYGCTSFRPDTSLPVTVVASPNQDVRHPTIVVIHYTSNDDVAHSMDTLTSPGRRVSAHYLIGRQGELYQLVPEDRRAWHAGKSYWAGITDINSTSIGIEIDNNGSEAYEELQIQTLLSLLKDIQVRHKIQPANFVGHADVAPGRKVDPGPYFPWRRLADSGFGLWCDDEGKALPDGESADLATLLSALGYDPRVPEASRQAFRSHYLTTNGSVNHNDEIDERRIAQCLLTIRNSVKGPRVAVDAGN